MKLLKIKKLKIGEVEYPIKLSIRAVIEYENMTSRSASSLTTTEDVVKMLYCGLKAGGSDMDYDTFLSLIDDNPESIFQFMEDLASSNDDEQKKTEIER